jgi:hypothetical protein
MIDSFLGGRLPSTLITPIAFAVLAILIMLYTLLTTIARSGGLRPGGRRSKKDWDD